MAEPQNRSLLDHAVARGGVFKGARAAAIVVEWANAVEHYGHELGALEGGHVTAAVREYGEWAKLKERARWNDLKRFREVFPEEQTPARLARLLLEAKQRRAEAADPVLTHLTLA